MERRFLWTDFIDLKAHIPSVPWLAVGDFNVIREMEERSDYFDGMVCTSPTSEFQSCLNAVDMLDLHHVGPTFTWTNKRVEGLVAKNLDRFLANPMWFQSFSI